MESHMFAITYIIFLYELLSAFAKLRKATKGFVMSVCLSVCLSVRPFVRPHGKNRLPLDGFSWNSTCEYFSKICPENSSFFKI
jgi:hypothetical protein